MAANAASEFEQYQWAKHKDGLKDVPLKAGNHAMDALRYLVMDPKADDGGHKSLCLISLRLLRRLIRWKCFMTGRAIRCIYLGKA
jgi:hypothetical protein